VDRPNPTGRTSGKYVIASGSDDIHIQNVVQASLGANTKVELGGGAGMYMPNIVNGTIGVAQVLLRSC